MQGRFSCLSFPLAASSSHPSFLLLTNVILHLSSFFHARHTQKRNKKKDEEEQNLLPRPLERERERESIPGLSSLFFRTLGGLVDKWSSQVARIHSHTHTRATGLC